jgi:DNA-directed RNA polymerase specialized sigma24 family protein/CheY-like chemotaxis protein
MKTVANDLRRHLPYARRFARALCGSQEHGDAYIVRTLETLISDRSIFDGYDSRKNALFATFLKLWNEEPASSPQQAPLAENAITASADRKLQALPPRSRQAFLLVSMENFTTSDTAQILHVTPDEVNGLIETATMDIASEISTDVLIIEDEPLVAMDLEAAMLDIGHRVIGVASTHAEAVEMVRGKKPGLVLADIQLADGSSGLDAVNEMLNAFEAPVIFITAFPERLLTGEKPEPAFLITKPFDLNVVKAISSQALFFDQNARRSEAAA